jgi:hypothetical protein
MDYVQVRNSATFCFSHSFRKEFLMARKLQPVLADGDQELFEVGDYLVLRAPAERYPHLEKEQGIVREGKYFVKQFPKKRFFYKSKDIDRQIAKFKKKVDFVVGVSGYTLLNATRCAELGIKPGAYEAGLKGVLERGYKRFTKKAPQIRYGSVYGAAYLGVDLVQEEVAYENGIPIIGTSCVRYLWVVHNGKRYDCGRKRPVVLVGQTGKDYNDLYLRIPTTLLAANGGPICYEMDIAAATGERKIPFVPVDIFKMLGVTVAAWKIVDGKMVVNDAVGAINDTFRVPHISAKGGRVDLFSATVKGYATECVNIARGRVSPRIAFLDEVPKAKAKAKVVEANKAKKRK